MITNSSVQLHTIVWIIDWLSLHTIIRDRHVCLLLTLLLTNYSYECSNIMCYEPTYPFYIQYNTMSTMSKTGINKYAIILLYKTGKVYHWSNTSLAQKKLNITSFTKAIFIIQLCYCFFLYPHNCVNPQYVVGLITNPPTNLGLNICVKCIFFSIVQ